MTGSNYDDIIGTPHHVSPTRPQMSMHDRAAQFSPFAALTGYGDAVAETARLTDPRAELDEDRKAELDRILRELRTALERGERPTVCITQFVADDRKEGGAYVTLAGTVKRLDVLERRVVMDNGQSIPVEDIFKIERMNEEGNALWTSRESTTG